MKAYKNISKVTNKWINDISKSASVSFARSVEEYSPVKEFLGKSLMQTKVGTEVNFANEHSLFLPF